MIPEDDRTMYSCPHHNPRHLSAAVDKFEYILPYDYLVGGVFAISKEHYRKLNGYSNTYWGWGAEGGVLLFIKLSVCSDNPFCCCLIF